MMTHRKGKGNATKKFYLVRDSGDLFGYYLYWNNRNQALVFLKGHA